MPKPDKQPPIDSELLKTVASDLRYIAEIASGDPDFDALRRLSVQMRMLINDNLLIQAWRSLCVSEAAPAITAIRIDATDADPAGYSFAGGGGYGGIQAATFRYLPRALTSDEIARRAKAGPLFKTFPLHEYKESASAIVKGKLVTRHQVIAYVAHKKGGAHLDRKRKKDDEAYKALDDAMTTVKVGGIEGSLKSHDPVSYELLSIAQSISGSDDIRKLLAAIDAQFDQR